MANLVIQPSEADSKDAWIASAAYADMNFGDDYEGYAGVWVGFLFRSLFQFDLSPIPANATVTSAILTLTRTFVAGDPSPHVLYRVVRDWTESEVTWNSAKTGTPWAAAGCDDTTSDREATGIGTFDTAALVTVSLDVAKVQEWINGTFVNNGMVLVGTPVVGDHASTFAQSGNADANKRPKLAITYTLPVSIGTDMTARGQMHGLGRAGMTARGPMYRLREVGR